MSKDKSKKDSAPVKAPAKALRKCARRRNGVPGANTTPRKPRGGFGEPKNPHNKKESGSNYTPPESIVSKLFRRPLYESRRNIRLCRKLGIDLRQRGHVAK